MVIARRIAWLVSAALAAGSASGAEAATLVYCSDATPEGFDPAPYTLGATFDASAQMLYDRLVAFRPGTTEVVPALAERWEVSGSGLEYTFHLRPGVTFAATDGFTPTRPLNADDVVFSFTRQWDEEHPWYDYAGGVWPYFAGMAMPGALRAVQKVDDDTVVFVLNRPDASFPATLAMDFASILSREYADALLAEDARERLDSDPVGTGPFRLADYDPGVAIRYTANPDYWGGRPAVDELAFDITPEPAIRLAKLMEGSCDVAADPGLADLAALPADSAVAVVRQTGANVAYLAYNTAEPPLDRPEVRAALALAVDTDAIVAEVFRGEAAPAASPLSPATFGHDAALAPPGHDPAAARERLAAAGAANLDLTIRVLDAPRAYNPDPVRTAEMIRTDLAAVGVDAEVVAYDDPAAFLRDTAEPEGHGAALLGWQSDNGDPDNVLSVLLGCDTVGIANRARWCDARFDRLVRDARATADRAARASLYQQAEALFAEALPWLPIAHANFIAAVGEGVEGVEITPLGRIRLNGARRAPR